MTDISSQSIDESVVHHALRLQVAELQAAAAARERAEVALAESQARLQLLNHVSREVTRGRSVEEILEHAVAEISACFPGYRVIYATLDEADALHVHSSRAPEGMSSPTLGAYDVSTAQTYVSALRAVPGTGWSWVRETRDSAPTYLRPLHLRKPVLCENVPADPRFASLASGPLFADVRATLDMPLRHSGRCVDFLGLGSPNPHSWTNHEMEMLHDIGEYLAVALWDAEAREDRRQAEQAVRESEARFRRVFESDLIGALVLDSRGNTQQINGMLLRTLGYTRDEFLAARLSWRSLTPSELRERDASAFQDARDGKPSAPYEKELLHRDGRRVPVLVSIAPIEGDRDPIVGFVLDLSERERAEAVLRQSDEDYRARLEQSDEAILLFEPDEEVILDANRKACEVYGYSRSELVGKSLRALAWNPPPGAALPARHEGDDTQAPYLQFETTQRRSDGTELILEVTASRVNFRGRPAILTVNRDISARRNPNSAEQARLRRSAGLAEFTRRALTGRDLDQKMREAVDLVAEALSVEHVLVLEWRADDDRFVTRAGRGWPEEIVRHAQYAIGKQSHAGYTLLSDRPVVLDDVSRETRFPIPLLCREYDLVSGISVVIPGPSAPFGVLSAYSPRKWTVNEDDIAYLQSVANLVALIRQQVRTASARIRREEQYRALFSSLPDIVIHVDRDHQILYASPAIATIMHRERNTYMRKTIAEVSRYPDLTQELEAATERVFSSGLPEQQEVILQTAAGPRSYQIQFVPETIEGEIVSVLSIMRDRSATRGLDEDDLAMERKRLESQKLESLGVMAGGIAHDFNNLLQVIQGNAELAQMELSPNSPAASTIKKIEVAAQSARDLTQQMLAYSGKGRFVLQRIDLNAIVNELAGMLASNIGRMTAIHYDLGGQMPLVDADPAQLRQVLTNLVINASDAIGDHPGSITVTTGVMSVDKTTLARAAFAAGVMEGDYVFLEVSDTGEGIDAATRAKIFEPFFTTKFMGRGLGLAAVQGIARSHAAVIQVESEVGAGTTIRFLMPAATAAEQSNADAV